MRQRDIRMRKEIDMVNEWIPCRENLPKETKEYVITTETGQVTSALYLPNAKKWVDPVEEYFEYSCIAWIDLEAYKEK